MGRKRGQDTPTAGSDSKPTGRAVTDPLTSVDDLLRETNEQLAELTQLLRRGDPIGIPEPPSPRTEGSRPPQDAPPVYPYDFSGVVPGSTLRDDPQIETFNAPADGVIRRVVLGWPAGTQQAVGIGLDNPDNQSLIPRGPKDAQYLAYNNEVLSFDVNQSINDDSDVQIRFVNNDTTRHFVNVEIFFQRRKDGAD
jgi:hypothetical protein